MGKVNRELSPGSGDPLLIKSSSPASSTSKTTNGSVSSCCSNDGNCATSTSVCATTTTGTSTRSSASTTSSDSKSDGKLEMRANRRTASYERCVNRLREEDIDRLSKICKLHLSFLMDMNNERFEQLFGEKPENKSKSSGAFLRRRTSLKKSDSSLIHEKTIMVESHFENAIEQLISYLQQSDHLKSEGLFRKSGNIGRQRELKEKLEKGEIVDFHLGRYTSHDCASVLKLLLGDTPEPLLLERLLQAHLYTLEIKQTDQRVKFASLLLQMLPVQYYKVAKDLFNLLHTATQYLSENKMSAQNLGAIFAPNILCSKKLSGADLQKVATKIQSVVAFLIMHTPSVFQVPEMLALDVINYIRRSKSSLDTSEDSIISAGSLEEYDRGSTNKRKAGRRPCSYSCDEEPMDTVVTFTARQPNDSSSQDTEVELAKLYAHVQSMPESAKKRKLMKQFSDANGYRQQVNVKRKHSRSRSIGDSIKRRFSRRGRHKSLNVSTDNVNESLNSSQPTQAITVKSFHRSNPELIDQSAINTSDLTNKPEAEGIEVTPLVESPYSLHRTSVKNLRDSYQPDGAEDEDHSTKTPSLPPQSTAGYTSTKRLEPEGGEKSPVKSENKVPKIRKPLLPTEIPNTPDSRHMNIKRSKEYKNTPPGPKRVLKVVGGEIQV